MSALRSWMATIGLAAGCFSLARADVFIVTESAGNAVSRLNAVGAKTTLAGSGLNNPQGVVADADGNLFVADAGSGQVLMLPAGGGAPVPIGDAVNAPSGLAIDGQGVLYVATTGDDLIKKLVGSAFVTFATLPGGASPRAIAFDPSGNLFVANSGNDTVSKVTTLGGVSTFSSDVTAPFGLAFSAAGKLHVSDSQSGGRIATFNPNGNSHVLASNLGAARGLGFDPAGDLFFVTGAGSLRKVVGNGSTEVAPGLDGPSFLTLLAVQTRIVAFKGQSLASPAGAQFAALGSPAVGGAFTAFKGSLAAGIGGVAPSNALGLWRADSDDNLSLLARRGFTAPGTGGAVFAALGDPVLNDSGAVAFLGKLAKGNGVTSVNAMGVWSDITGSLSLIARQGDAAPGLDAGVRFTSFKQIVLPDDAGPAVLASVSGPGISSANNLGLWSADTSGALSLVVRKGDGITVAAVERTLQSLDLFVPTPLSMGQSRNVAAGRQFTFRAGFAGGEAVVLAQPGQSPAVLAATGEPVGPALDPGSFAGLGSPCVSDAATAFGFLGTLAPGVGDITSASKFAVFSEDGACALEARKSFAAPGTNGAIFASLSDPAVNGSNALAVLGRLKPGIGDATAGTAAGLWCDAGSGLGLISRQGDAAAGIKGAVTFRAFKQFVLPDVGGVLFTATVAGSGVSSADNFGIWASDGAGGLDLLIRKGDALAINGTARTVASTEVFKPLPGVSGQSRSFNHAGDLGLVVKCTDAMQAIVHIRRP